MYTNIINICIKTIIYCLYNHQVNDLSKHNFRLGTSFYRNAPISPPSPAPPSPPPQNHMPWAPICWPRWLSWMRCPTGDQEVAGSTPAEVGNILSWRLIMKYFLRSLPLIQEGQLSVSGERMYTILVNRLED